MPYTGNSPKFFPGFECLKAWFGENVTPTSVTVILSTVKKYAVIFFFFASQQLKRLAAHSPLCD